MAKRITKIVLTGGPAAGKTTLVSRVLKEFKQEDGWRVITIPETATELISGFGIKPFDNCMSMLQFQDFVVADQIHKEKLALDAAQLVPEDNILILYDRALMDDKAYVSDEEFAQVIARFDGRTEERVLANYDMVLHLITCAKGAEFAYDLGNNARTESIEFAREMDDRTLRAWSAHPNLRIIDNDANFNNKIERALREIYRAVGEVEPMAQKRKYLIAMPDMAAFSHKYRAAAIDMTQTYLALTNPNIERRVRMQNSGAETLYFYTEKHRMPNGEKWDTERPISQKQYEKYLLERDTALSPVRKTKYRFVFADRRCEIDVYPFSAERAVLFQYGQSSAALPEEITVRGTRITKTASWQLCKSCENFWFFRTSAKKHTRPVWSQKKSCPCGQLFSNLCSLFGDEGEQSDLTGALDGLGQLTLMHRAGTGGSAGQDLRTLGDEAAQLGGVLIVDILALVNAELAHLFALAVRAAGARGSVFAFHSHG